MIGFLWEKLEQDSEFRSEDLKSSNRSERLGNDSINRPADSDLGFVAAKTVK